MPSIFAALTTLSAYVRSRTESERGAVTIEYGILAVFIALALIVAAGLLVGGIETWFTNIRNYVITLPDGS